MLATTVGLFIVLVWGTGPVETPEPLNLDTLNIHLARTLSGQCVTVSFLIGKPPYTFRGNTIVGTGDTVDGVERTAVLKGWRVDVREGRRLEVVGVLKVIDHPGIRIGGEIVPPWVEIRVEQR